MHTEPSRRPFDLPRFQELSERSRTPVAHLEWPAELGSTTELPDAPLDIIGPGEESGTFASYVELVIEEFLGFEPGAFSNATSTGQPSKFGQRRWMLGTLDRTADPRHPFASPLRMASSKV